LGSDTAAIPAVRDESDLVAKKQAASMMTYAAGTTMRARR
jgi:hypothetical protein